MGSFGPRQALLLLSTVMALEMLSRFVLPLPVVKNFNRIQFTKLGTFGGLAEVAKTGGSPTSEFSYRPPQPLRNVKISWISDPDGVDEVHTLNLYGFRGPDFVIEKAPGTRRVIFLGDSFTEGFGVADDATIPVAFQRELGNEKLEVLNLGIGAIGLRTISALASIAIPLLEPDYVVLVVYQNDLPAPPLNSDLLQPGFKPVHARWWLPRLVQTGINVWRQQSPALFYHRGPFAFFSAVPHPSNPRRDAVDDENYPPEIAAAMRAGRFNPFMPLVAAGLEKRLLLPLDAETSGKLHLSYMKKLCGLHGCSLLTGFIPVDVTVSDHYYPFWNHLGANFNAPSLTTPAYTQQQRVLGNAADELKIPFVDTTAGLRRQESRGQRMYSNYDEHMNAAGYALVGKELARRFESAWPP